MSFKIVASNTSPLIFLEKINSIQIVGQCFESVIIAESVYREWGVKAIPQFIQVETLSESSQSYVEGAIGRLHRGELETVRLAIEKKLKYVLLDDLLARRYAERNSLIPIGILGILKIAYYKRIIPFEELKTKIDVLINTHNLFVSDHILEKYLNSFS